MRNTLFNTLEILHNCNGKHFTQHWRYCTTVMGNILLYTLEVRLVTILQEVLGKETFSPPVKTAVAEVNSEHESLCRLVGYFVFCSQGYFYLADLLVAEEGELNRIRRETKVKTWRYRNSLMDWI